MLCAAAIGLWAAVLVGPSETEGPVHESPTPNAEVAAHEHIRDLARPKPRRFMVGAQAVGYQMPAIAPREVDLDARYVGETSPAAGLGVVGRFSPAEFVALEIDARSGSARFRADGSADAVSLDLALLDVGVLLYLLRGDAGRLGLDAGVGGGLAGVRYDISDEARSRILWGFGSVRAGVDAEITTRRLAFLFGFRVHGVFTDPDRNSVRGPRFDPQRARAPVPALQTWLAGSVGVAYRF